MVAHAYIARTLLNLNKVLFSLCERVYVHVPSAQKPEDTRCLRASTTGICRMSDLFLDSGITAIPCTHWGISPALDFYVVKFTNILAFDFLIFQKHTSILGSEIFPVFLYPLLVSFYHLILEAGCHLFCKD